nr:DUF5348 domain-containing protein [Paenibacillus periandrae]
MTYDRGVKCWFVQLEEKAYPVYCGECFETRIGDRGIPCRIELDRHWYVIMREARFNLRNKDIYHIRFV